MKAGGSGVLPFVVGLGAAYVGYLVLRRIIPPPPENVTKPGPARITPEERDEPTAGFQAALQGFVDQFGPTTEAEAVTPPTPAMRFEEPSPAPERSY